ncbi:MAG: hypothetical protein DBX55_03680 [Verrucomicrobia bacterium]|nr:MAG: hypothetical protein DBX55_03680 [Verrucomicrobiota bacterium]
MGSKMPACWSKRARRQLLDPTSFFQNQISRYRGELIIAFFKKKCGAPRIAQARRICLNGFSKI